MASPAGRREFESPLTFDLLDDTFAGGQFLALTPRPFQDLIFAGPDPEFTFKSTDCAPMETGSPKSTPLVPITAGSERKLPSPTGPLVREPEVRKKRKAHLDTTKLQSDIDLSYKVYSLQYLFHFWILNDNPDKIAALHRKHKNTVLTNFDLLETLGKYYYSKGEELFASLSEEKRNARDLAITYFDRALTICPNSLSPLYYKLKLHLSQFEFEKALEVMEKVKRDHSMPSFYLLAFFYCEAGDYIRSVEIMERLSGVICASEHLICLLDRLRGKLENCVPFNPDFYQPLLDRVLCLYPKEEFTDPETVISIIANDFTDKDPLSVHYILQFWMRGNQEDLIEELCKRDSIWAKIRNSPQILFNLGVYFFNKRDRANALKHFEESNRIEPTFYPSIFYRALIQMKRFPEESLGIIHFLPLREPKNQNVRGYAMPTLFLYIRHALVARKYETILPLLKHLPKNLSIPELDFLLKNLIQKLNKSGRHRKTLEAIQAYFSSDQRMAETIDLT